MYRSPAPISVTKESGGGTAKKAIVIVGLVVAGIFAVFLLTVVAGGAVALRQSRQAPSPPTAASR